MGLPSSRTSRFVVALAISLISWPVMAQLSMAELIDVAGRQRMLSQRIVKAYAQVAQDVQYEIALEQLHSSIEQFEYQMAVIKRDSSAGKVHDSMRKVEQLWKPFREIAGGTVSLEGARQLMQRSETLLEASHKVVLELEDLAGLPQARVINISGRQRMLSQRIAKAYMLLAWGLGSAALRDELERSRYEFEGAMVELRKAKENSEPIRRALDEVERQWTVFRGSFDLGDSGTYVPLYVAMSSEKILVQFDEITRLYASAMQQKGRER